MLRPTPATVDRFKVTYRSRKTIKKRWEREIEHGEYRDPSAPEPEPATRQAPLTVLAAAVGYLKAGGEGKNLGPILEMTGPNALRDKSLAAIDQFMLDTAATELYPNVTAATRNRQFYTPASAVLKHGGIEKRFKRPKGWRGNKSTSWLEPEQAFRLFAAADQLDLEFGLFLRVLLYTGMRLGDALGLRLGQVNLKRQFIYLPKTKNSEPRAVYLPKALVVAFGNQPARPVRGAGLRRNPKRGEVGRSRADAGIGFLRRHGDARLFRFHAGGYLRTQLKRAMKAAGLCFPRRQGGFHLFCHTYGTWMHRYGGLDNFGLTRTDRWKDPRSADRYRHTGVSEESRRAALLPVEKKPGRR